MQRKKIRKLLRKINNNIININKQIKIKFQ